MPNTIAAVYAVGGYTGRAYHLATDGLSYQLLKQPIPLDESITLLLELVPFDLELDSTLVRYDYDTLQQMMEVEAKVDTFTATPTIAILEVEMPDIIYEKKQRDTIIPFKAKIYKLEDGEKSKTPFTLTGTATLVLSRQGQRYTYDCVIDADGSISHIYTNVEAAALPAGEYDAEIQFDQQDGAKGSAPTRGYYRVRVHKSL